MAVDLGALISPAHTAVLTMEMQRGVVGDLAALPHLRDAVAARQVDRQAARLVEAARRAGTHVVHCTVAYRPDLAGTPRNAPLLAALGRGPVALVDGAPATELIPGLAGGAGDVVEVRRHGISPFGGTSLDATLRGLGVRTIIASGVSVNLGIFGLVVEAVNHGYQVVLASDAVVGVPPEYGDAVVARSLALLAMVRSVDELVDGWGI